MHESSISMRTLNACRPTYLACPRPCSGLLRTSDDVDQIQVVTKLQISGSNVWRMLRLASMLHSGIVEWMIVFGSEFEIEKISTFRPRAARPILNCLAENVYNLFWIKWDILFFSKPSWLILTYLELPPLSELIESVCNSVALINECFGNRSVFNYTV